MTEPSLTLTQKLQLAAVGYSLTEPQKQRIARTLTRQLEIKSEEDTTIPELQGMIEIVQIVLPAGLSKLLAPSGGIQ